MMSPFTQKEEALMASSFCVTSIVQVKRGQ